jgi:hypothetical protein
VRSLADDDPVRAGHVGGVLHDQLDVLLVADVEDAADAELLVGEQLADEVDRPLSGRCGRLGHGLADEDDALRSPHPRDDRRVPVGRDAVPAVRSLLLDLPAEPLAQVRVAEPLDRGSLPPAFIHPGRTEWR